MNIRVLDNETISKIAAGEVIERPASIVKELVENSLDAGALRIAVDIEGGGMTAIRVSDNGCGILGTDMKLALERHATSKISSSDDLWDLKTYGFRGEALYSVAAVSRFEMISRPSAEKIGFRILTEGLKRIVSEEEMRQEGTTVCVTNLFFNSPARRKFLKSAATEFRHIVKTIISYALARLDVDFTLRRDGKVHISVSPAQSLTERVAALYSEQYRDKLMEVFSAGEDMTLGGFIIDPNRARRRGAEQWLFVNGRPFASRPMVAAVHEGYRSTLSPGTSPDFILFLNMPPHDVDVNVHPTKKEVKFRNQGKIFDLVSGSIRKTLGAAEPVNAQLTDLHRLSSRKYILQSREGSEGLRIEDSQTKQMALFMSAQLSPTDDLIPDEESGTEKPVFIQLHQTYIVATTDSGIVVIDQHSAHERIIYEELMGVFTKGNVDAQRLLFPITIQMSHQEEIILEEYRSLLTRFGFDLEQFGERTYLLQSVPAISPGFDVEVALHAILGDLSDKGMHEMNQYEKLAKVIACRTAIKAGMPLNESFMSELLDGLFATSLPYSDIHGRPTIVQIDLNELNRRFGRI